MDTLDEALEKAIEQAGDDPHRKSVDQASQTFVEALAEGEDADPWGDTALPVPDRFTENGEPPVVTLTGLRPPGGIETAGGTVRIRFVEDDGTVTTEVTDPPAPPGNKPLVTDRTAEPIALRMWPPAEAVHACSFWIPAPPDRRRPADRRRHSSIGLSACLAPLRAGGWLSAWRGRPWRGCIPMTDIREDHSMKLLTEAAAHEAACKWDPKGGRPQARGQVV